jgi:hypothetical protein
MKRLVVGLGVAVLAATAHAVVPNDFAYGLRLQLPEQAALYQLRLPPPVYQGVTRPDLSDVRVFNGQGEAVPHAFRRLAQPAQTPSPVSLPLFPLPVDAASDTNRVSLHVKTDAHGRVIDVQSGAVPVNGPAGRDYLIDANALKNTPDKLLLVWEAPPEGFVATVSVEYSQDLNQWQPLVPQAPLADINYGGHTLSQREIALPPVRARYLRLHWPAAASAVQVKGVQAAFPAVGQAQPLQWISVAGQRLEGDPAELRNVSVYQFDATGFFPIDSLRVRLPQRNTLIEAVLLSRAAAAQPWRERYRGALYQLQVQGAELQNTTLALDSTTDRYWRLEVDDRSGGLGKGRPSIEFGWLAQQLVFVAQGDAPFTLAYGRYGFATPTALGEPLLSGLEARSAQGLIKQAQPGEAIELGGTSRLQPRKPGLPWKSWLLWAALVLGVLVLAVMVRRLYRQMNANASAKPRG